ncbi:WD40 repeat domain-containing serine/threonine protein kinase [Parafrankia sp. EUN1f]|uniref:WD40 repeat domain-containing serine/threonine protein kinase n=1 Tax=Parafrankia sp. EUN1f TaxID=102897 RepID=UPI0001C462A9|nr:serine/threonine-protein kinase [Parafrankia sp. EUN1f]EFC83217.1 serine/threonine protein kinase with WD40 repeats [Parafrankia sp. EUN1f]
MLVDRARVAAALPGYELGEQLGSGGFGLVLAASHRRMARDVAIKVLAGAGRVGDELAPGLGEDRAAAGIASEAVILANLDHPHIVRVYDYLEFDDLRLIVMEKLSGGPLSKHLNVLGGPRACAVGLAVASALTCAHGHGVLHRDIKPENMLFDAARLLKVADFGIAKLVTGPEAMASAVVGTPLFMAPEQLAAGRLSAATDLYSLGVVLHLLLSGGTVAAANGPAVVPPMVWQDHLAARRLLPEDVPAPVTAAVLRALAEDPAQRPISARELAMELAEAAASSYGSGWIARTGMVLYLDEAVRAVAERESPSPAPPPPAGSTSDASAVGASASDTPAPATAPPDLPGSDLPGLDLPARDTPVPGGPQTPRPGAARRKHRATAVPGKSGRDPNRRSLLIGLPAAAAVAAAGVGAAVAVNRARDSTPDEPVLRPLGAPLPGHTGWITSLVVFPDGRTLASGSSDGTVLLWDVSDPAHPQKVGVLPSRGEGVLSLALSTKGDLVSGHWDRKVRMWNVRDPENPTEIDLRLPAGRDRVTSVSFGDDPRILVCGGQYGEVRIWNVADPASPRRLGFFDAVQGTAGMVPSVADSRQGKITWARPTLAPYATFVVGYDGEAIQLWDLADLDAPSRIPRPLRGHSGEVHGFAFSRDGLVLASGGKDLDIRLWDLTNATDPKALGKPLTGHRSRVWALAFSSDRNRLVSGSWDRTIRLWDVENPAAPRLVARSATDHKDHLLAVAFAPGDRTVFSGCKGGEIRVWDVAGHSSGAAP